MSRFFWLGLYLTMMIVVRAQDTIPESLISGKFTPPVDHPIRLAGSFGELRDNHFHAGIDIKSKTGEIGDTVRAAMSGYISRIKVQTGGYGKAIYIDHPNGMTTVYAHLNHFSSAIDSFIRQKQKDMRSYEVDTYLPRGKIWVKQGQYIGKMGNTGRSLGPHLHFEIRNTITEVPVNPYLYDIGPGDDTPPVVTSIDVHGIGADDHSHYKKTIKSGYKSIPEILIPAWKAGISIQTFDRMKNAKNHNGTYDIKVFVDDTMYYHYRMDSVGFDVSRYINSHIDYVEKIQNKRVMTRCFTSPFNPLKNYLTLKNRGIFRVYSQKLRDIRIEVLDFAGNKATYRLKVKRNPKMTPKEKNLFQKLVRPGEKTDFCIGSSHIIFSQKSLDRICYFNYTEVKDDTLLITFDEKTMPVFAPVTVMIDLKSIDPSLWKKVVLVDHEGASYGGELQEDSLRVSLYHLGKYSVLPDTVAPNITPKRFLKKSTAMRFFRFEIKDNFESKGDAHNLKIEVFIDDHWQITPFKSIDHTLTIPLDEITEGEHFLRISAQDHSGNKSIWESTFAH